MNHLNETAFKTGDNIIIEVCKPDGFNAKGVYHKGELIFTDNAFSIKREVSEGNHEITPISYYASYCKITLSE